MQTNGNGKSVRGRQQGCTAREVNSLRRQRLGHLLFRLSIAIAPVGEARPRDPAVENHGC